MIFKSPITGKEVSKATYYRHMKKMFESKATKAPLSCSDIEKSDSKLQQREKPIDGIYSPFGFIPSSVYLDENRIDQKRGAGLGGLGGQSQFQSHDEPFDGNLEKRAFEKFQSQSQSHETFSSLDSQYDALFEVFKHLFLAASSRGIPKKIVLECEKFL